MDNNEIRVLALQYLQAKEIRRNRLARDAGIDYMALCSFLRNDEQRTARKLEAFLKGAGV